MANIKQVAAHAGVSPSCVSKYLRDKNSVRAYNKERIEAAINELQYVPSRAARSLRQGRNMSVKVIMPSLTLPFFAEIFELLHEPFIKANYNLILQTISDEKKFSAEDFSAVDGVIITFPDEEKLISEIADILKSVNKPLVTMVGNSDTYPEHENVTSINVDICDGMAKAAQYMIDHGRKQIAYVGGKENSIPSSERFRGFSNVVPESMRCGIYRKSFSMNWGFQSALQMLKSDKKPDTVLCENDGIAAGIIKCMTTHGYKVPEDIWVIGFDDIPLADMYNPSISSVALPSQEISAAAAKALLNLMNKKEAKHKKYQTNLIIRESSQNK